MSSTQHPDLYDLNIFQSFYKLLKESPFVQEFAYPVNNGDRQFNPKAAPRWVEIVWVSLTGRMFSHGIVHLRCFSRSVNDRFGRDRELMIGRLKNALAVGEFKIYDVAQNPPLLITSGGDVLTAALRFSERSAVMDAEMMGEQASATKGVDLVVLTYDVHVARLHEVH